MTLSKKQIVGIVFGVFIATIISHYQDFIPYRWQSFNAPDGSVSVPFPSKPRIEERRVPADDGGSTVVRQIIAQPSKPTSYSCVYFDDPRLATEAPEQVLDAALNGAVSKMRGQIVTQRSFDLNGHPAKEARVRGSGNSDVEMRLIIVGKRNFLLMVVDTAHQSPDTKNVQKFFNSSQFSS